MAFAQPMNPDDDEKQQQGGFGAPAFGGGGGGAPGGAPSFGAPQVKPATGGGTGFVNLMDYMKNASNDRAGKVAGKAGGFLDTEKSTFEKAAQPLREAKAPEAGPTEGDVRGAFKDASYAPEPTMPGSGSGYIPEDEHGNIVPGNPKQNAFDKLKGWLDTSYTDPLTVDYTPDRERISNIGLLGGKNTALNAAYGDEMKAQPTSLGQEMLDQALMQGDGNVRAAQTKALKDTGKFLDDAGAEKSALEEKVRGYKATADATRNTTADTLRKIYDEMSGTLDARVDARKKQELDDKMNGIVRDPVTGAVVNVPAGQIRGEWQEGSGLDRAGLATRGERSAFEALKGLIGTDALGDGKSAPGGFATKPDANVKPPPEPGVDPRTAYYETNEQYAAKNLNEQQQAQYKVLRGAGLSHTAAMKKIRGGA